MAKTNKNSTPVKRNTKSLTTDSHLAQALKEWAIKPSSHMICQFYLSRFISKQLFYQMVENSPELQEAHTFAKEMCGINRYKEGKSLGMNASINYPLSRYIDVYKEQAEFVFKLNNDQQKQLDLEALKTIISSLITPFPSSGLVPSKPTKISSE